MPRSLARTAALSILCGLACGVLSAAESGAVCLDVPFVKQSKEGCGAACIAMVMQYWLKQQGRPASETADATQIQRVLYASNARGIYASAMEGYLKENEFSTFSFHGEWDDLHQHLGKGRPLIVALKPAVDSGPVHYVVVAGVDSEKGLIFINDPAQRKLLKLDRLSFEKRWSGTGNWSLLALPRPTNRK
jgi:ABC-type bacteriocin/lantibiotic exporter with double-glycine peptidase domain